MSMPRFDNTWTFGNTITIVMMAVGLVGLWNEINKEVSRQSVVLTQKEQTIQQLQITTDLQEARIRALELGAGRTEEKLINIIAYLDRIEKGLNK